MSEAIPRQVDCGDSCSRIWLNDLRARGLRPSVRIGGVEQKRVMSFDLDKQCCTVQLLREGVPYVKPGTDRVATTEMRGCLTVEAVPIEK